ncbi:DUF6479 family protein [Nocardia sp. BMG51109]|uniref:DUF6479 family protein n=1 Tax=Nocardia sp. BMG51109 TaxID=1056816 RepID=UPI0021006E82|nr:DUF6479 family protein [Nocardia sp. BMG51109]
MRQYRWCTTRGGATVMTTLLIVLGIWVVCSIPVALVLGRLFRSPRPRKTSPESQPHDDESARARPPGRL